MVHDPVGQNVGQNALCMHFDGPKSSRLYHSCSLLLYSSAGTCTDKSLQHSTKKDLETTHWKILSTQCNLGPPVKCSAFLCAFFRSLIFAVHALSLLPWAPCLSFIQGSCSEEHAVFSLLSCCFLFRLNLASCRTWCTINPCHSSPVRQY